MGYRGVNDLGGGGGVGVNLSRCKGVGHRAWQLTTGAQAKGQEVGDSEKILEQTSSRREGDKLTCEPGPYSQGSESGLSINSRQGGCWGMKYHTMPECSRSGCCWGSIDGGVAKKKPRQETSLI